LYDDWFCLEGDISTHEIFTNTNSRDNDTNKYSVRLCSLLMFVEEID